MESRLGHDFGQVRVHIDAKSADAARAVNAVAYTIGRDIVFTAGQYAPESAAGRRLLAHELTHVVQQRAAAAITPPGSLAQAWIQQTGEAMAPGPQPADRPPVASSDESGLEQDAERSARRLTNRGLGVAAASASPIPPPRNVLARAAVNAGISGAAEALPAALASHVRRHLDIDPEEVRIHRDTTAAAAARVLGANGYAYGHHVVLGHDAQNVDSPRGFATLAHELGHVAQQQAQPATGLTPRPQFSLKTYIAAMNKQPEPDWKTAAEHLNGEDPATIKQILKGLSQTYRAKLHEAAREWPGACSNIGQLTRADYLAAHPEIKSAPADSCDKKEAAPADAKAILTDATPAKAAAATAAPPASNARLGRVGAAIKLLKMQWDRYKANPQDKAIHDKYVVGIERFVVDTVTDHKMFKAFSRLAADEQRTGRDRCNEALSRVKSLESAFRTGYPRLDDERTWKSAIGAMGMAQRYLELIVNYREPIPLKDGWHLVVNDSGTVLGYFYLSQGYWKVLDDQGKFIESGEAPLERPLIDPIDIAAGGIAGVMRGAVVGAVEGALSTLARRAAPRVGAAMIAVDIGLETAVPGAIGRMAPRALIMSETLTSEAVSRVLANAGSTLPKATAAQAVSSEASAAANTTLSAAGGSAASGTMTGPASAATGISGAQSLAGGAGASATSNVAGATTVQVSPAEYAARLGFVFPQQFDNAVLNAVERAGQQAATVLSNASNPTGARFIQACQARQWTLAGTLFHAEAARQLTAIAATLTGQGIQITAEDTVQAGTGGSRLDVTAVDATGNHYNIDWKTTGRSALTAKARAELQRHAGQYAANRGATLDVQISKSWVDFVRALIPGVTWPK
jgi:hypothetical protein